MNDIKLQNLRYKSGVLFQFLFHGFMLRLNTIIRSFLSRYAHNIKKLTKTLIFIIKQKRRNNTQILNSFCFIVFEDYFTSSNRLENVTHLLHQEYIH